MTVEGDLVNRCEIFDEAISTPHSRGSTNSAPAPRLENAASRAYERFMDAFRGPRLGQRWPRSLADGQYRGRSSSGRECRGPTRSRCRDRRHAGDRSSRGQEHRRRPSLRPAGSASPSVVFRSITARPTGRSLRECSASSRSTPTTGSRRRRCSTSTTSTPPSLNSTPDTSPAKRPPTRTHGRSSSRVYAAFNRREIPATTPDWVNIDHRRGIAFAPGDLIPYIRAAWDVAPDVNIHIEAVHRLSRPRSGRHPCGERDLARGLRRRVAEDRTPDGRRRPDQPLRDVRRGRPRRRARSIRRTRPAGPATREHRDPGLGAV